PAAEREAMLSVLESLDTPALWQVIHRGAENEDVLVLAALNEKRQRQGLSEVEEAAVQALIRQHDRAVLLRAKALAVLRQRGEDEPELLRKLTRWWLPGRTRVRRLPTALLIHDEVVRRDVEGERDRFSVGDLEQRINTLQLPG